MKPLTVDAITELLTAEQQSLIGFLTMLTGDRSAADDLYQETFLEILRIRYKFEPGTDFGAWAHSVARIQALRFMRKRQKEHLPFSPETVAKLAETWAEESGGNPACDQRRIALKSCMAQLDSQEREVLAWRYYERHSHQDIAGRLGRSVAAVKMLLSRIRNKLRLCAEKKIYERY